MRSKESIRLSISLTISIIFLIGLYLNLRRYVADTYLNLLFAFIADGVVLSYPLTDEENKLEYGVMCTIRWMVILITLLQIVLLIAVFNSVTGFTLIFILKLTVDCEITSNLLSTILGVCTVLSTIIFIIRERC